MIDASATNWVIDVDESNFEQDVIIRSQSQAVLIDFWAPWCGPCKQLTPLLVKLAKEMAGAICIAKVNVDEAQQIAAYFRIESIPMVVAFKDGQPVNAFTGLVPEAQLREFIAGVAGDAPGEAPKDPLDEIAAMEESDPGNAEIQYREYLKAQPEEQRAMIGLARILCAAIRDEEALKAIETIGEAGEFGAEATKIRRTIEMRANAASAGDEKPARANVAKEPENAQYRLELANILATQQKYQEAMDHLLVAAEHNRELGRGPVRELMVKIFEIIGVRSEMADEYRDKLRALLY